MLYIVSNQNYLPLNSGTTTLRRHWCVASIVDKAVANTPKITSMYSKRSLNVSATDRKKIKKGVLSFIVNDIRPMYSITGFGLRELLSIFTYIGSIYGMLDADAVKEILPCPSTVTKNILELKTETANFFSDLLKISFSKTGGAITLDGWSDSVRKVHYIGFTCHFITESNEKLILHDRVIGVILKHVMLMIEKQECILKVNCSRFLMNSVCIILLII